MEENTKPSKLFISHSAKDKDYVQKLVEMFEDIGMPESSIVCTSVPGYGIPNDERIYDWLRNQFLKCKLRVLFLFSDNYFASVPCLNEMGAAWIVKTEYTQILLPGFSFGQIKGCVDSSKIGISFDADIDELKCRLNELKNTLISEFSLVSITESKWERHRDELIRAVRDIAAKKKDEHSEASEDQYDESELYTDDEKILMYYLLTKETYEIDEEEINQSLIDDEIYDVNVHNGFALLSSLRNSKYENKKFTLDISVFRQLLFRKKTLLPDYNKVRNEHQQLSVNEFHNIWKEMPSCAKLLAKYISDEKVDSLGSRWKVNGQVESIKQWEYENDVGACLSTVYEDALNYFVEHKFVYASEWTSYGNPRKYSVCNSLKAFLWDGMKTYTTEINELMTQYLPESF